MRQLTHAILYEGPSAIDGSPIVCIAVYRTGKGVNGKTGAMAQTYIIRADMAPLDAIRAGADVSICGDCVHRGDGVTYGSRSCYVNVGQGPTAVFGAYARGRYARLETAESVSAYGQGRMIRLGSYGDPAAVPASIWTALTRDAIGSTGYTHQWRASDALRGLCMASADTEQDHRDAIAAGWRTFRVRSAAAPVLAGEFPCPASAEAGRTKTCVDCGACKGARLDRTRQAASPVIIAHGSLASRLAANVARASLS